jgi:5-methylthioadenosine/S-adenosylhomocysteine deaminase
MHPSVTPVLETGKANRIAEASMPANPPSDHPEETPPDLIVQGGTILTMVDGRPPLRGGMVRVRDGRILSVDDRTEADPGVEVLDARNGLILPGLVNAHGHTAMTLFRGFADDLPLAEWLFDRIFPAEARFLDPNTVYWGTLLGCLEMIASGTTCVVDGYFYQDATVEAVERAGLRALIAQGVIDFPAPGVPSPEDNLTVGRAFLESWSGFSERITPGLFCHSPSTCSEGTLRDALEISRFFGVPLQTHLSETAGEVDEIVKRTGTRPVNYLDRIGVLAPDLVAAHAVHLDAEEIDLLVRRRVRVAHLPESNMKLASGAAPIHAFLEAGVRVGLGTDGCASNNDLDLLREMDTAAKLGKVVDEDPTHLSAEAVLRMATLGGAEVAGLEREIGTLEEGKRADLIVIDPDRPHLQPLYHPASTLVYSASGADVRHVVVDGRVLLRDGAFTGLDPDEIMGRVAEIARTIRQG